MSLDGISLSSLVKELRDRLTGGRVDKIFQPEKTTLLLAIRTANETVRLLLSATPEHPRIQVTEQLFENPTVPPAFCMLLRKHLEGGRIAGLEQDGLDRIVHLYIDYRGEQGTIVTKCLTAELMGKHSNLILTQDTIILDSIKRVGTAMSRFRQVLPGLPYTSPPGQPRLNLLETTAETFITAVSSVPANSLLTKALINTAVGIGPIIARELAYRSGLPADITIERVDNADISELTTVVHNFITDLKDGQVHPTVSVDSNNRLLAIASFVPGHLAKETHHSFATMSQAVDFVQSLSGRQQVPEKDLLRKLLLTEMARLERKHTLLNADLVVAQNADELRKAADTIMTYLPTIQSRATQVILPDLYGADPDRDKLTIVLDPQLTPVENAQGYYSRYNKQKRAQELVATQLRHCKQEAAYLDSVMVALEHSVSNAETTDITLELTQAGYIRPTSKRRPSTPIAQPLHGQTTDGTPLLIGKNNRQNDLVTFKLAHADDIWFHTKDIPGSHVILRTGPLEPSPEGLRQAAQIAAFFSKARASANVPVDYTRRRYVKKPSGSKPGFVIYERQTTLFVTPDETLIDLLLKK